MTSSLFLKSLPRTTRYRGDERRILLALSYQVRNTDVSSLSVYGEGEEGKVGNLLSTYLLVFSYYLKKDGWHFYFLRANTRRIKPVKTLNAPMTRKSTESIVLPTGKTL